MLRPQIVLGRTIKSEDFDFWIDCEFVFLLHLIDCNMMGASYK